MTNKHTRNFTPSDDALILQQPFTGIGLKTLAKMIRKSGPRHPPAARSRGRRKPPFVRGIATVAHGDNGLTLAMSALGQKQTL
jgi:hypothetical protein